MKEEEPKKKYNARRELVYFQNKFFQIHSKMPDLDPGRDITLMKRIGQLFDQHQEQLGALRPFVDMCLEQNKNVPIGLPYLMKATNKKLGDIKLKPKNTKSTKFEEKEEKPEWLDAERKKWNNRFNKTS